MSPEMMQSMMAMASGAGAGAASTGAPAVPGQQTAAGHTPVTVLDILS